MKKTLFIINPIAGVKNKKNIPTLIEQYLDKSKFLHAIAFTEYAGHGKILAKEATQQYDIVVAVGGDGTVNEIASGLLHSNTYLGIIPMGSGNGLARHLKIPIDSIKAIQFLNQQKQQTIDTCTLNGKPFFCTAGVGFDGYIGDVFARQTSRGLWTYIRCAFQEYLNYSPKTYFFENRKITANLITVANANQFGNNAFISPLSNIQDGKMEICILRPFPLWKILGIAIQLFTKKIEKSPYYDVTSRESLLIENPSKEFVHIDGEPIGQIEKLSFKIVAKSLKVIA